MLNGGWRAYQKVRVNDVVHWGLGQDVVSDTADRDGQSRREGRVCNM